MKIKLIICVFLVLVIITSLISFKIDFKIKDFEKSLIADCGCDSLWAKKVTKDFVSILESTTQSNYNVWKGYNLNDGIYILNAGQPTDSTYCLGIWKSGKNISYRCSKDAPRMLTPIYSYYLAYKGDFNKEGKLFKTCENAPDFTNWVKRHSIEEAVYMPTDFPKFPFKISAKSKVQLAVHEMFHVQITLRKWYTNTGFWPNWDKQPDRKTIQSCYNKNEIIINLFKEEQNELALLIEFLLDENKIKAIESANKFIEIREERYQQLTDTHIKLNNSDFSDCRIGEAIMEIEEGIADYASWVAMYNTKNTTKHELLRRYKAEQKDMYYMMGCMLLHASALMNNGNDKAVISKMVNASSIKEGNLYHLFKEQLESYKAN